MANRTFLLSLDIKYSSLASHQTRESMVVCAASYMIPLFWYTIFDKSSVKIRRVKYDANETFAYPVFESSKQSALERSLKRVEVLNKRLKGNIAHYYPIWRNFVAAQPGSYFAVETVELWMMDAPYYFENHINKCLSVFSKPRASNGWGDLLGQANIDFSSDTEFDDYKLCGYSYVKDVPWENTFD